MNGMQLLSTQIDFGKLPSIINKEGPKGELRFDKFLQNSNAKLNSTKEENITLNSDQIISLVKKLGLSVSKEDVVDELEGISLLENLSEQQLVHLSALVDGNQTTQLIDHLTTGEQEQIKALLNGRNQPQKETYQEFVDKTDQTMIEAIIPLENILNNRTIVATNTQNHQLNEENLMGKFTVFWEEAKMFIKNLETTNEFSRADQLKVMKLLEQWTTLEQQVKNANVSLIPQTNGDSKEEKVWKQVLTAYQNRYDFQAQQKYQTNSVVTSSEIFKMLKAAIARYSSDLTADNQHQANGKTNSNESLLDESRLSFQTSNGQSASNKAQPDIQLANMSLSKVEQFVVHLNQSSSNQNKAVQQEKLFEEFRSILKSSRFLSNNGSNQLLLKLRPENLGDMGIKLTQINGEMMVKITVTSQMAKEMLDGNLQQLRHMFSPHQVVVERQELATFQQEQSQTDKQEQQSFSQSNQEDTSSNSDDQEDDENGQSFHQILLNEKV